MIRWILDVEGLTVRYSMHARVRLLRKRRKIPTVKYSGTNGKEQYLYLVQTKLKELRAFMHSSRAVYMDCIIFEPCSVSEFQIDIVPRTVSWLIGNRCRQP